MSRLSEYLSRWLAPGEHSVRNVQADKALFAAKAAGRNRLSCEI